MPEVTDAGTLLISMPEIADLAGVLRPVVTTWRRRHADFPSPVPAAPATAASGRDAANPMFGARAVVDWLTATGRAERARIEPDLRLYLLRCLGQRLPARTLVAAASALICLRHLDGDEPLVSPRAGNEPTSAELLGDLRARAARVDPSDRMLRAEVAALGPEAGWLVPAVDELVEAAWGTDGALRRLLVARHRFGVPELYADALVPALPRLIAALTGARERADEVGVVHVADPAAGIGDLLAAVLSDVREAGDLRISAVEPDRFLARLARRRFAVAGLPGRDITISLAAQAPHGAATGSDRRRGTGPDVVVTCLPFQPSEQRNAVDVLVSVRRHAEALHPGQTAVVLGPADVLVDALPAHTSAVRRRDELLRTGLVEAVIALPGGMVPFRPGYRTALWVLRREDEPAAARGRVLLVDLTVRELTDAVVDLVVEDVSTWRRDGYRPDLHHRAFASQAAISQLTTAPGGISVALTAPRPPAEGRAAATVARIMELGAGLDHPGASTVAERRDPRPVTTASIARLARTTGADGPLLRILPGARLAPGDVGAHGQHRVLGAPELTGASQPGRRMIDRLVLAETYRRVILTEPGDVVVATGPRFAVHVDDEGYAVAEFPARVLRITDAGRASLTPRVLAALLVAAAPTGRTPGAVRSPRRLEDLQIAALPEPVVRRLDALLTAADARRARALRELDMLHELTRTTVGGLAGGALTFIPDPHPDPVAPVPATANPNV